MKNNPMAGGSYLMEGLRLVLRPGLRRYVFVPLLINILVFSAIGWLGFTLFSDFLDWMLPETGWLSYLRWLLWPFFALVLVLITFYTFTTIANLIAAPFNSLLAERVEMHLTGKLPPQAAVPFAQTILPAIWSELGKIGYYLLRAVPLLLLSLIPGINIVASPLLLAFNAWFLCLEYVDYPMGNSELLFKDQLTRMRTMRRTALGFGGSLTLLMMIPIVNFAAMPAAVAGATALWCRERDTAPQ
jgi:CysZ protein